MTEEERERAAIVKWLAKMSSQASQFDGETALRTAALAIRDGLHLSHLKSKE